MPFTAENKENLIDDISLIKRRLDTLITDIQDISEDGHSLEFGPANIDLNWIESDIRSLKRVLKEFQELAPDLESSQAG
jgi:hypothetical protein